MSDFTLNVSDTRVVATYYSKDKVKAATAVLVKKLSLSPKSLKIISPDESNVSGRLESRREKVGENMLTLHFVYGSAGLIISMLLAHLLIGFGPEWAQQNQMFTYIALVSPGLFIGLFVAGFLSLKPERDIITQEVVKQNNDGKWTLVIDTENEAISRDDIVEEVKNTNAMNIQK